MIEVEKEQEQGWYSLSLIFISLQRVMRNTELVQTSAEWLSGYSFIETDKHVRTFTNFLREICWRDRISDGHLHFVLCLATGYSVCRRWLSLCYCQKLIRISRGTETDDRLWIQQRYVFDHRLVMFAKHFHGNWGGDFWMWNEWHKTREKLKVKCCNSLSRQWTLFAKLSYTICQIWFNDL